MNRRFRSRFGPKHHIRACCDDLIHVHVGLSARAGLPHHQWKVLIELALDHLLRGMRDCPLPAQIKHAKLMVHLSRGAFDDGKRTYDRLRDALLAVGGFAGAGTAVMAAVFRLCLCSAGGRLCAVLFCFTGALLASPASSGAGSNCRPNCTDGSKNPLIAANGTVKRSGTPPND